MTLLATAVVTQIAVFSTTIFLHRAATHRALTLHPVASVMFRFALWVTTGLATKEWVAVHRKHHAFTDIEGDPHSPKIAGFWSVQFGNVFHYIREARKTEVVEKYARDINVDVLDRMLFNHGFFGLFTGILILCAGGIAMTGSFTGVFWGLLAAGLHAFLYIFVLSSSINGLCHQHGYKNFDNTATNIRVVALLTGGEGLHNNHHAHQMSPKFSFRRWEFDPAWPVIRVLALLRLAHPHRAMAGKG